MKSLRAFKDILKEIYEIIKEIKINLKEIPETLKENKGYHQKIHDIPEGVQGHP